MGDYTKLGKPDPLMQQIELFLKQHSLPPGTEVGMTVEIMSTSLLGALKKRYDELEAENARLNKASFDYEHWQRLAKSNGDQCIALETENARLKVGLADLKREYDLLDEEFMQTEKEAQTLDAALDDAEKALETAATAWNDPYYYERMTATAREALAAIKKARGAG